MNYVLVYCEDIRNRFILIRKQRPARMQGKLNLPGGKIEPNEKPIDAAYRELQEETGICKSNIIYMYEAGTMWGIEVNDDNYLDIKWNIHIFNCGLSKNHSGVLKQEADEPIDWVDITIIQESTLMNNLRVVLPLLHAGADDWDLEDTGRNLVFHKF